MLDLVWVAETACPAPLPLTLCRMEPNLHHGRVGKMVLMGKLHPMVLMQGAKCSGEMLSAHTVSSVEPPNDSMK